MKYRVYFSQIDRTGKKIDETKYYSDIDPAGRSVIVVAKDIKTATNKFLNEYYPLRPIGIRKFRKNLDY